VVASCGLPILIPEKEQDSIKNKFIVSLIDGSFAEKYELSIVEVEVPEFYKEYLLSEAYVTYWMNGKPVFHADLAMREGYSYGSEVKDKKSMRTGSKVFNVSINNESYTEMKITLVFGEMCYSRYQLNLNDLENYKITKDKTVDGQAYQNLMFLKGRSL